MACFPQGDELANVRYCKLQHLDHFMVIQKFPRHQTTKAIWKLRAGIADLRHTLHHS